jgi:hypothetical protein
LHGFAGSSLAELEHDRLDQLQAEKPDFLLPIEDHSNQRIKRLTRESESTRVRPSNDPSTTTRSKHCFASIYGSQAFLGPNGMIEDYHVSNKTKKNRRVTLGRRVHCR